jgi:DNA-directed RNA polymerase subunit H (RpoH/RPB5)
MSKDMKAERLKILDLLAKNVINAEQAEKLLAALNINDSEQDYPSIQQKKSQFRMLKIYVDSNDGDQVRVQLPIEFAKLLKSKKFMKVDTDDLDLDIDELIGMINSGVVGEIVNIESADGDIVKIVVE